MNKCVEKSFDRMCLSICAIYCVFNIMEVYFCRVIGHTGTPPFDYNKYNFPFPYGWGAMFEWTFPLLLCIGYMAARDVNKNAYYVALTGFAAGVVELCCGDAGLKLFESSENKNVFFDFGGFNYWKLTYPKWGVIIPIYFVTWCLIALLLLMWAPQISIYTMKCKKTDHKYLVILYFFCLGEGILFNVAYLGEYNIWFAIRNVLLLFLLVCWWRHTKEVPKQPITYQKFENNRLVRILVGTCALGHVIVWLVDLGRLYIVNRDVLSSYDITSASFFWYALPRYFCRYYAVVLVAAFSIYVLSDRKSKVQPVVLAFLCGTAFLVEQYVHFYDIRNALQLMMTAERATVKAVEIGGITWLIILYVIFEWFRKPNKKVDIAFLLVVYAAVLYGTYVDRIVIYRAGKELDPISIAILVLYIIMFVMTILLRMKHKEYMDNQKRNGQNQRVWIVFWVYGMAVIYNMVRQAYIILKIGDSDLVCTNSLLQYIYRKCGNVQDMYAVAFFLLGVYVAYALKKSQMKMFCTVGSLVTLIYLDLRRIYTVGKRTVDIGIPIPFMILIILLVVFLTCMNRYQHLQCVVGRTSLLITYGIIFYEYTYPFIRQWKKYVGIGEELYQYPYLSYTVTQVILAILAVVSFMAFGKKAAPNKQEADVIENTEYATAVRKK